jgi:PAS domain S-box-containing protein
MKPIVYKEAEEIWKHILTDENAPAFHIDLEVQKKLLNIFQVGDYYYYIFDLRTFQFDYISEDMEKVLGYSPGEMDVSTFRDLIHPEDQPWFVKFEAEVLDFFLKLESHQVPNYKIRYDFRIKRSDGAYIRLLQQVITIEWGLDGTVYRTFGVHTDITHLKQEGMPVLSFIGLNGEPSFLNVNLETKGAGTQCILSGREVEILSMMAQGKSSKVIADELSISKETVDKHRKNILAKTNTKNTAELITFAIRNGWI